MADMVGGDTIGELMDAFSKFQNHDGLIGTPELKNVLRSLGHNPTDAELQELAYAMDTNESGTIDLPEFLQAMAKNKADEDAEEDIREAFKIFDKDGDDYISPQELRSVMTQMGEPVTNDEVDAIIREADTDGDGSINYAEFFTMFYRKSGENSGREESPVKSGAFCAMNDSTKRFVGAEMNRWSNMPSTSSSSTSLSKRKNSRSRK